MSKAVWNRMYRKIVRAARRFNRSYALVLQRRWLAVMQRRTGKVCFLQPWQGE